ncbi:CPBP family glutamic-type intramembrane protease [Paenibacillus xylanexedens]|uniref:CPBP family glutamic-type intramembrane protease n=1 Tax=Paenibacillus xylanexedens TaxID=528191 RepID=UPI003D068823
MSTYMINDRKKNSEDGSTIQSSRKGLFVFFAMLIPLTIISYVLALNVSPVFGLLLMWTPGLSSIFARIVLHEGFSDISLRIGGKRTLKAIPFVLLLPVVIGLCAYGFAWLTGLVDYVKSGDVFIVSLVLSIIYQMFVGTAIGIISSAGEELGWRGYMLTRLIKARVPKPILTSGLIWGAWHIPAILLGNYYSGPSLALSIVLFLITISSSNFIISHLRLSTGSIWPVILLHASWNAIIQDAFDEATKGENVFLWTGESGILVAFVMLIATWIFSRKSDYKQRI